jgi:hypothetical protein
MSKYHKNELPRSKLRGILTPIEKFELLTMQFLIFFSATLLLDICRNGLLIAKLPNGIDEISLRPKLATPKNLLHRWHSPKYLSGRYALDRLNNFLRTIHWHRLDQKMNMIAINSNFQKTNLISLRYFQTYIAQLVINFFGKYHSAILSRTYHVVQ